MQGEIISVDAVTGDGRIQASDGRQFTFRSASCLAPIEVGQQVEFVELSGGAAGDVAPPGAAYHFSKRRPSRAPGAMDWSSLFLTSDGRLRRSHYWIGMAILLAVNRLLGGIPILGAVSGLVTFVLCFALQARRLRDIGQSAWWLLFPLGVWIAGWVTAMYARGAVGPTPAFGPLAMGAAALFALIVIVVLGAIPGQRGRNRYGPDTRPVPPEATAETFG